ncbi:hypothetical protein [Devosia sp.]|uniref:hypothetical protein n=1 Tax=Devosia sp. TaxID=1871048 RepID=UPI002930CBE9|nr:hypothetical protein [Devosia sp.]
MTESQRPSGDEGGTFYEVARAPVQLRAVAAVLLEVLALLPKDGQAQALKNAESRLASDPGASKVLAEGLRIEFRKGAQE